MAVAEMEYIGGGGPTDYISNTAEVTSGDTYVVGENDGLDFVPTRIVTETVIGGNLYMGIWDSNYKSGSKIEQLYVPSSGNGNWYEYNYNATSGIYGALMNVDANNKQFTINRGGSAACSVKWVAWK